jgi:glutamyl-tRNA synthetase
MAAHSAEGLKTTSSVGRLAPSPTGALHLGNARTFLLAWLSIRKQSGTLVLRMEDIDTDRVKPGASEAVVADLNWLGLDWDFGPGACEPSWGSVELVQSRRTQRYQRVLHDLIEDGRVYPCDCTRSQIARQIASAPHEKGLIELEGPVYPGTCRWRLQQRQLPLDFTGGQTASLRWAFQPETIHWTDQLLGLQSARPMEQLGDFVIARNGDQPSYQLAVVVDDYDMQVTEVVRGDDLVASTFRQQAMIQHLGWPSPKYYHVPLVLGPDGKRLAKRKGDSLAELRQQGISPTSLVGFLAASLGLIDKAEPVRPLDLVENFQWDRICMEPTVFSGQISEFP